METEVIIIINQITPKINEKIEEIIEHAHGNISAAGYLRLCMGSLSVM